ncbi:MAG: site-specific DNA-methyltransferase [bacterium]|nr:site-specific DNA-methyltransferase [bacterium]
MQNYIKILNGRSSAESRWLRFGPYYAMFPMKFAFKVINNYSNEGDFILDPFSGRGTSIIAASLLNRKSVGIEINPLGWIYTKVKLNPSSKNRVINRLDSIYKLSHKNRSEIKGYPKFYKMCFCGEVLTFLITARNELNWKFSPVDRTLMSFLLVYLHGKIGEGLSNQMMMTKSMGDNYSIKWWREHKLNNPPKINPYEFIKSRVEWRYEKGRLNLNHNEVHLGDSSKILKSIDKKFNLLFTSPPYWSLTDYHVDQWLRLWLLGYDLKPKTNKNKYKGRFVSKANYRKLLDDVFFQTSKLMKKNSVIYVRTDSRSFTLSTTKEILTKYFPRHQINIKRKPFRKKTQTELFGNKTKKSGEIDIILTP